MRLQTESSVIIDDQIPDIPQERLERMYPVQKISIYQNGYREVDINEITNGIGIGLSDLKDCPKPEPYTNEEFDTLPRFKGEAALVRYAAYLSWYKDKQSFLDAIGVKVYKCWRSKKYLHKGWLNFYIQDYLYSKIYWKHYVVLKDKVFYSRPAAPSSRKTWIKINWELLFVYITYVYTEEVIPYIDYQVPSEIISFSKQIEEKRIDELKEEQKRIMKEVLELINATAYSSVNFKEQREAVKKKYKNDIRIQSMRINGSWTITIVFKWRRVEDQTNVFNRMILPPLVLSINIFSWDMSHEYSNNRHPHCLSRDSFCLWEFKQIISTMIAKLSLEGIVDALVNFACTFTGTDCWTASRAPWFGLKNYLSNQNYIINPEERASDITYRDLLFWVRTKGAMFDFAKSLGDLLIPMVWYVDLINHDPDSEYYLNDQRYAIRWSARDLLDSEVEEARMMYPSNEIMQIQEEVEHIRREEKRKEEWYSFRI